MTAGGNDPCAAMDHSVRSLLRHFATTPAGARFAESPEHLLLATATDHLGPMHNATLRTDPAADPHAVIAAAEQFFGRWNRRFVLWAGAHNDDDLAEVAAAQGFALRDGSRGSAGMLLRAPLPDPPGNGTTLIPVRHHSQVATFTDIVAQAFAARKNPQAAQPTRSLFTPARTLLHPRVIAYLAVIDEVPCGAAMAYLDGPLATLAWISTTPAYRYRGVATRLVTACVGESFRRNAHLVALQSSTEAETLYARLGFQVVTRYARWLSPAPASPHDRTD